MIKYAGLFAALLLVALPAAASDRTLEVAAWYVFLQPSAEATVNAGDPLEPFDVNLTSDTGYGVSGSIFFSRRVSAELAFSQIKTGVDLEAHDEDSEVVVTRRQSSIMPATATLQFHFAPDAMIDPYIGVGAMKTFFGSIDPLDDDDDDPPLSVNELDEGGIGYLINVGMNVELMEQFGLLLDAKWAPSTGAARAILNDAQGTSTDIKVNPIIISLGVSYRF
ncbi:MAG TPA: OmpW family outer membrane protein [Thermoanaerobaculia bacterium]|nr:OmpW family outer membrane protein [Thermoanaerobaculia bacterium]